MILKSLTGGVWLCTFICADFGSILGVLGFSTVKLRAGLRLISPSVPLIPPAPVPVMAPGGMADGPLVCTAPIGGPPPMGLSD